MYTLLNHFYHVILIIFLHSTYSCVTFFYSLLCSVLQTVSKSRKVGALLLSFHFNAQGPEDGLGHCRLSIKCVV